MRSHFKILATEGNARAGILQTGHGEVQTPVFMPVGTQASVKAISPDDLKMVGAQIILGNTYHLYLRPGSKTIKQLGGLHTFMDWHGPILTDSGGFQAFSLGQMISHGIRKVPHKENEHKKQYNLAKPEADQFLKKASLSKMTEDGVEFKSHLDGSTHLLTPERSIEVQLDLGSDIVLVLDELLSPLNNRAYAEKSLERTHRWEVRSKEYFEKNLALGTNPKAQIFGILQGVYDKQIREDEAKWITSQEFSGVSIGGSFGTSEYWGDEATDWAASKAIYQTMEWVVPMLPEEWPKHALGIGEVQDFFECIERGIDMFDCVAPTRRARNGSLYIQPKNGGTLGNKFTLSISRAQYILDKDPIDPGCDCYTCTHFSRTYLRHLYISGELLFHRLATIHNLYFMLHLVDQIRQSVKNHQFQQLKAQWI